MLDVHKHPPSHSQVLGIQSWFTCFDQLPELLGSTPSKIFAMASSVSTPFSSAYNSDNEDYFTHSGTSTPSSSSSICSQYDVFDDFVLVVGGLGYIGSHTCWELIQAGRNVVIIDDLSNSDAQVLDKLIKLRDNFYEGQTSRPIIDFYKVNYRQMDDVRDILAQYEKFPAALTKASTPFMSRITCVIHFAAYKAVEESIRKPLEYYTNNVSGLIDFCRVLGEFRIKTLVFSSSATVYGDLANRGVPLVEEQCDSSKSVGLTNPYGRTKWMCEAILSDLANSDPKWKIVALRYFNPIGCDESGLLGEEPKGVPNNLMPIVVEAMTGKRPALNIFGTDWNTQDGTAIRDFIHVSDLAEGHLAALEAAQNGALPAGYHVYNLGTGTGHSVTEIVGTMETVSGRKIPTVEAPRRAGDVSICIANTTRTEKALRWKTKRSLQRACWDICRRIGYVS